MKNSLFALSIISGLFLSSCGVHSASMGNLNSNVTHVQLDEANFEIVRLSEERPRQPIFSELEEYPISHSSKKQKLKWWKKPISWGSHRL